MPFLYVYVCDLLEHLGELYSHECPTLIGLGKKTNDRTVRWLQRHKDRLNEFSVDSRAVMMFFTPQSQTDRDYGLDADKLEQLIARVLCLTRVLRTELRLWRQGSVYGDLGACVKRVMDMMPLGIATQAMTNRVTVEEIDQCLLKIASHNPKSSPEVRSLAPKIKDADTIELLGKLYRGLAGREAKWLTRLILKNYGPITFPQRLDCSSSTQLLPGCVQVSAEISIVDAFPALRDGAGLIKGTALRSSNATLGLATPRTVSPKPKQARRFNAMKKFVTTISTQPRLSPPRKMRRLAGGKSLPTPPTSALQPSSSAPNHLQSQHREPLSSLDPNGVASQHSSQSKSCQPSPSAPTPSKGIFTASVCETTPSFRPNKVIRTGFRRIRPVQKLGDTMPTSQLQAPTQTLKTDTISERPQHTPLKNLNPIKIHGTGVCRLTTQSCQLSNCIFILAPCLANILYINENLLSWHGSLTITSLRSLSDPSLPRHCPQTGKKYRKIALVEMNRLEPTKEFIIQISRLNLMRSKGRKEWVEVFDWRILEAMTKIDQGQAKGYDPWRRNWVGAV